MIEIRDSLRKNSPSFPLSQGNRPAVIHPPGRLAEKVPLPLRTFAVGQFALATEILERLEVDEYFASELKSADFMCLLGMCRIKTNDSAGAFDALTQAIELDPEHEKAKELLDSILTT